MDFGSLEKKNVAVVGAGVEGISTVSFLKRQKVKEIFLLDQKALEDLDGETLEKVKQLSVNTRFGPAYLDEIGSYDLVFRSPAVHPELLSKAKATTSQTRFFLEHTSAKVIGVTGTKGKGTTSTLISKILEKSGKQVYLGGNIGKPMLDFLEKTASDDLVVLELSSFQLCDVQKSPHLAVVLMITSEHLDWHPTTEDYVKAKGNICAFQSERDFVVINYDFLASRSVGSLSGGKKFFFSTKERLETGIYLEGEKMMLSLNGKTEILNLEQRKLIGPHNLQNIAAAALATALLGVKKETIERESLSFSGLEHRLEFVARVDGVDFYNDSMSTNPETTIAAIDSFDQNTTLILGGSSKNSDFTALVEKIKNSRVKSLILIGVEAERIKKTLGTKFTGDLVTGLENMKEIVQSAKDLSKAGDVVLFSPACASFDMFKTAKQRGAFFKEAVKNLETS